jgi:hypothetical protein
MECTHHLSRFCGTLMMRVYAERQAPIVKRTFFIYPGRTVHERRQVSYFAG